MRNKRDISTNKSGIWSRITPVVFRTLTWVGMVLIWSVIISFVLDMPNEASLRKTNDEKRDAYDNLVERYVSLAMVLENVTARDENVFRKLFESNPYDLNTSYSNERHELHRELIDLSDDELLDMLDLWNSVHYRPCCLCFAQSRHADGAVYGDFLLLLDIRNIVFYCLAIMAHMPLI